MTRLLPAPRMTSYWFRMENTCYVPGVRFQLHHVTMWRTSSHLMTFYFGILFLKNLTQVSKDGSANWVDVRWTANQNHFASGRSFAHNIKKSRSFSCITNQNNTICHVMWSTEPLATFVFSLNSTQPDQLE